MARGEVAELHVGHAKAGQHGEGNRRQEPSQVPVHGTLDTSREKGLFGVHECGVLIRDNNETQALKPFVEQLKLTPAARIDHGLQVLQLDLVQ